MQNVSPKAVSTTAAAWQPPATLLDHGDQPLSDKLVFFAPPPAEIGDLLSANSSLEVGKSPKRRDGYATYLDWFSSLIFASLAGMFSWFLFIMIMPNRYSTNIDFYTLGQVLGVIVGGFVLWRFSPKVAIALASCSYVGTDGVAEFLWDDAFDKRQKPRLLRFQNATELRVTQTRTYINNAYMHTTFMYHWTDAAGKTAYILNGLYRQNQKTSTLEQTRYRFTTASEDSWTLFALERAKAELGQNGTVRFNAKDDNALILGNGFLEIYQRGETVRLGADELARVSVDKGVVTIAHKDAKRSLFGSQGFYKFDYYDIANAKLFLGLLNALVV
jgi:hypothetical protein